MSFMPRRSWDVCQLEAIVGCNLDEESHVLTKGRGGHNEGELTPASGLFGLGVKYSLEGTATAFVIAPCLAVLVGHQRIQAWEMDTSVTAGNGLNPPLPSLTAASVNASWWSGYSRKAW